MLLKRIFLGYSGALLKLVFLALLPLLAGCVCDPPVERLAAKKHFGTKKIALAVPRTTSGSAGKPAVTAHPDTGSGAAGLRERPTLRVIHVKNCDCPEDFDPQICGDRSAYTSWAPNCPSAAAAAHDSGRRPWTVKDSARP